MKFIISYKPIFIWLLSGILMCLFAACGFGRGNEESLLPASDASMESSQFISDTSVEPSQSVPDTRVEPSQSVPEAGNSKQEILSSESGKEQSLSAMESYQSFWIKRIL